MKYSTIQRTLLTVLCITLAACSFTEHVKENADYEVMVVKIPPFYDPSLTPLQRFYAFQDFLYPVPGEPPIKEIKGDDGTWRNLPHDDSLIYVVLNESGEISINSERQASLDAVTERLAGFFADRTEMGIFAPGSDQIVKAVGVQVPESAKYHELIQVVKAVKNAGADPVILLLDGHLPGEIVEAKPGQ